jgi:radical SAM protein with 4Fe4S-binding SPASM domain
MHKYFHLSKQVVLSNFKRLSFPYKLTFAVTYRCNSRCKTCNIWRKKSIDELSLDEIERFFKNSNGFNWIDITGGEPSLRKDFVHICEIIHRYSKHLVLLHFPTNGYLTDKIVNDVEKIRKMGSSYRIVITVSTDGDEKLNDEIRGIKGAWKRQIETFIRLREIRGVETVLGMTLSPFNFDKYEATFNSIKEVVPWIAGKDFHISLMNYSETFYDNMAQKEQMRDPIKRKEMMDSMIQSTERYKRMIGFPKNPRTLLEHAFLKRAKTYLTTGKTPLPCHALRSSCFIDPKGEVYPCITFSHPLGNLRDYDYDLGKIWTADAARRLQKKIQDFKCPQCWTGCDGYQTIMGNIIRLNNAS